MSTGQSVTNENYLKKKKRFVISISVYRACTARYDGQSAILIELSVNFFDRVFICTLRFIH